MIKLVLVVTTVVAACGPAATVAPTDPIGVRVVLGSTPSLYGVAWRDSSTIVLSRRSQAGARLFSVDAISGSQTPLGDPPPLPDCDGMDEISPLLSDGGLAWLRVCTHGSDPRHYSVMLELPDAKAIAARSFDTRFPVGGITFDGADWIADYGSRICNTIIRVTETGLEPVHVVVEGPDGSFDTGWDVADDCERMGISRFPAVRRGTLAFLASTASISKSDTDRLRQPSDLFVVPSTGGEARRIAIGLVDPSGSLWFDDNHLVVSGERPAGTFGTWLVDIESGEATGLLPFAARSMSRSPDGAQIVAMRAVPGTVLDDDVVVFPASLLNP